MAQKKPFAQVHKEGNGFLELEWNRKRYLFQLDVLFSLYFWVVTAQNCFVVAPNLKNPMALKTTIFISYTVLQYTGKMNHVQLQFRKYRPVEFHATLLYNSVERQK